jgi:hypothetical protein
VSLQWFLLSVGRLIGERKVFRMTENVCVTCQYYESCNRPERFMKCMGYKRKLQVGDKIQCGDTDDVIKTMKDLAKEGVETDFLYEKDGVQDLWLEVKGVKSNV